MDAIEFLQREHQKAKRERCLYGPIARDGTSDPRLAQAGREMRQSKAEKAGRPGWTPTFPGTKPAPLI